jgi:bacterioferritin
MKENIMKGNQKVIDGLNSLLGYELAAIDQYFIHSQLYDDWGFTKLFERISHESEDEKGHATKLIERMIFLGGSPDMVTRTGLQIGNEVIDMLESDLRIEYDVAARLKEVMALCETEQDYVTRDMLLVLLDDTEMDHARWLEQQLGLIKRLGLPNYLQAQL